MLFSTAPDAPAKNEQSALKTFYSLLPYVNEPKYDWCRGSGSSNPWGYGGEKAKAPARIFSKKFWDLLKINPLAEDDTFAFFRLHNTWLNTAIMMLPREAEVLLREQAQNAGFENWEESKKDEFLNKRNACLSAFQTQWDEANKKHFLYSYAAYNGLERNPVDLCVSASKMTEPAGVSEEKSEDGQTPWWQQQSETKKTLSNSEKTAKLFDQWLFGIPWNRWVERQKFGSELIDPLWTKVTAAAGEGVAATLLLARRAEQILAIWLFSKLFDKVTPKFIKNLYKRVVKWFKGGGPKDPPAPKQTVPLDKYENAKRAAYQKGFKDAKAGKLAIEMAMAVYFAKKLGTLMAERALAVESFIFMLASPMAGTAEDEYFKYNNRSKGGNL